MAISNYQRLVWRTKLLNGFSFVVFCLVLTFSIGASWLLSHIMQQHLIEREAAMLREITQNAAHIHSLSKHFASSALDRTAGLETFFAELARLPGVVSADAITRNHRSIWASNRNSTGERADNTHLVGAALRGNPGYLSERGPNDDNSASWEIENFIPVFDQKNYVTGVLIIRQSPPSLGTAIEKSRQVIWLSVLGGGLGLYLLLGLILRRSDAVIRDQQTRLMGQTRLATIGEMAASVAHSIRNPIASIRSSAEITAEETDEPEVVESMQDIISEVERFDCWIKELLTFTSAAGDPSASANLAEVIETSLAHFRARARRSGVSIHKNIGDSSRLVQGETTLLVQVMNSLIANAMDAMPHGGHLTAEITANDKSALLTLSDTGFGIPPERLKNLFDPLVTHKNGGLGIGLTLAHQIIKRYRGSITINSSVGAGTNVLITLPVTEIPAAG